MRSLICKTSFKYAPFYLEEARKQGQSVYTNVDENGDEFYCVDVLNDGMFWRSPNLNYKSFGNKVVYFEFKKEAENV